MIRIILLVLFSITLNMGQAQNIIVNTFRNEPFDVSAIELRMEDSFGRDCALIKVKTGLQNLDFMSDSGIVRIEKKLGEFWIWISPESNDLLLFHAEYPGLQYSFPLELESNNVYVISITAYQPIAEKIIFREVDTIQPYLWFSTSPEGADIYLNDMLIAETPAKIFQADSVFSFRLEKRKYHSITRTDTMKTTFQGYNYDLVFNPRAKRVFVTGFWGKESVHFPDTFWGIMGGRLGKTGWYASARFCRPLLEAQLSVNMEENTSTIFIDSEGYFFDFANRGDVVSDVYFVPGYEKKRIVLTAGLTQQLLKPVFINLGLGCFFYSEYHRIGKFAYGTLSSPDPEFIEVVTALVEDYSVNGMVLDAGLTFRIAQNFLLTFDLNWHWATMPDDYYFGGITYLGAGYNF